MFFRSVEIEEDLKCAYCKHKFTDVVKLIPNCGESICGECYEELKTNLDGKGEFTCKTCLKRHKMSEEGLPDNRSLCRMLQRSKVEKPLSKEAKELKKLLESLPSQLRELKSFDDRDYVHEFCDQLEVEIIEEIDSLMKLLNGIQEDLLEKTREYRLQCLDSLSTRTSATVESSESQVGIKQELQTLSEVVDEFNRHWHDFFNQADAYARDNEIEDALDLAREYERRMSAFNRRLKRTALNWQVMEFKASHSFLGDPSLLRQLFCLSIQDDWTEETRIEPIAVRTLAGHSHNDINELIFLSDIELASCSEDATIKVWNVQDGALVYELTSHTASVFSLELLKNGWLASGSGDLSIKLWDLGQRKETRTLHGHTKSIISLKVLKNGNLASYSLDDTIRIWNPFARENNLLLTITGHGNTIWDYPFGVLLNDNLLTISGDNEDKDECILRVWNSKDGQIVKAVPTGLNAARTMLVLSNDQVAVGFDDGTIKIIDLNDDYKSLTKEERVNGITALAELPNGTLACAALDLDEASCFIIIKTLSLPDLEPLQSIISDHSQVIYAFCVSSNSKLIASGSGNGTIKIWSLSNA